MTYCRHCGATVTPDNDEDGNTVWFDVTDGWRCVPADGYTGPVPAHDGVTDRPDRLEFTGSWVGEVRTALAALPERVRLFHHTFGTELLDLARAEQAILNYETEPDVPWSAIDHECRALFRVSADDATTAQRAVAWIVAAPGPWWVPVKPSRIVEALDLLDQRDEHYAEWYAEEGDR
jgi:hypothetical protein